MLMVCQDLMFTKMNHDVAMHNMLEDLTADCCKGYFVIIKIN